MTNIVLLLIASLLVLLNAFFVAAEFGMVRLRTTQIQALQENFGIRGSILARINQHLDAYLSACQLGITLTSLGLGWIGEPAFAALLQPVFHLLTIQSPEFIKFLSFVTAFSILSFLHIVVGELMPKSLAIRKPESISLWTAIPLYGFYWMMYPAIWLLNACSNFLLKSIGLDASPPGEFFYSTDEIKLILSSSHLHGELTKAETEIIEHTLDFAELKVTEVMRPREEMVSLDINQPVSELLETIIAKRFSRYPIYDTNKHDITGIIHVKDLFASLHKNHGILDIQSFIRPILKVSQRLPALDLLRKFREEVPHFALVYRNKEVAIGFVTLDNLLHFLIGRIKDEFHKTKDDWILKPDGTLVVKGDCSIYSLERALDIDLEIDEAEDIETVSGLIFKRLGAFPKLGDRIEFDEFAAVIEEIQGAHLQAIKIYPKPDDIL